MTIEEKRGKIEKFCNARSAGCEGCPLQFVTEGRNCYTQSNDPRKDADVEHNYRIISGFPRETDHPRCGLRMPNRLDALLKNPVRAMLKEEAGDQAQRGIDIAFNVDASGLDAAIEKANRLVELLESADRILDRVVQKMGAAKDTEK